MRRGVGPALPRSGLALFFTLGVSLVDWAESGLLGREADYYRRLAEQVGPVTFVTYGDEADSALSASLAGIKVLNNPDGLSPETFMRQAPRRYREALGQVAIMKSNQIKGADAALQAARLTGAAGVVRGGYLLSRFAANRERRLRQQFGMWRHEARLFWGARHVFLPTHEDAVYARRWYGLPRGRLSVLPNFIDTGLFRPDPTVPPAPGMLVTVGRLAPQKNLHTLVEAVAGLPGVRLRLIGEGPERSSLAALAASCGVHLEMPGVVPNEALPRLLSEATLFVLPSLYEGLPKALMEAMAVGLPVVATRVQGSDSLIAHGESGYLCDSPTPAALRAAIEGLLADGATRERLGRGARRRILERYSLEQVLAHEVETYKRLGFVT